MTRSQIIELMAQTIAEGHHERGLSAFAEATEVFDKLHAAGIAIVPIEPSEAMLQGACDKHKVGKPMSDTRSDECPRIQSRRRIYGRMITAALKGRE